MKDLTPARSTWTYFLYSEHRILLADVVAVVMAVADEDMMMVAAEQGTAAELGLKLGWCRKFLEACFQLVQTEADG